MQLQPNKETIRRADSPFGAEGEGMSTPREEVLADMPLESVSVYCAADEKLSNNLHHVHFSEHEADGLRAEIYIRFPIE